MDFPNKLKERRDIGVKLGKCDNFLSGSHNHVQCKSARISRHLSKPFSLSIGTLTSKWILKKFSRRFRFFRGKVEWMLMFTGCWCSLDLTENLKKFQFSKVHPIRDIPAGGRSSAYTPAVYKPAPGCSQSYKRFRTTGSSLSQWRCTRRRNIAHPCLIQVTRPHYLHITSPQLDVDVKTEPGSRYMDGTELTGSGRKSGLPLHTRGRAQLTHQVEAQ